MWCADPVLCLHTVYVTCVCVCAYASIFVCVCTWLLVHVCVSACRKHAVHKDGSEAGGEGE